MSQYANNRTTGGKGNINKFIERDHKVCAAGLPNLDDASVSKIIPCYQLQDHIDALLHDTIKPEGTPKPIRSSKKCDMRNAGMFSESSELINPPRKTKFQTLVEDFKSTLYSSYWKKEVGKAPYPKGNLPEGLNIYTNTMGKKYTKISAYEVIFPTHTIEDQVPRSKRCGLQTQRKYCSFNANQTFGIRTNIDSSSKRVKCCLTDDRIYAGNSLKTPMHILKAKFTDTNTAKLGVPPDPNNNIYCVPEGFAFGKVEPPDAVGVPESLTACMLNPERKLLKEALAHLNTVRKCMSKRFDGGFFHIFYLQLKYLDTAKTGWLPKDIIYETCKSKYIRLNTQLIEHLLLLWYILDDCKIEYEAFIHILNYREPLPELPKISDITQDCIDFRTTYSVMCNENVEDTPKYMAGVPSGRYLDKDYPVTPDGLCRADMVYLPQESDAKSCLSPSIFTLFGVNHRDMYAKRDAETIRKVFENIGEEFTDDSFNLVWKKAQKYHSQGWVSFETFRRALAD